MNLLKLLEGLYHELKTYNENEAQKKAHRRTMLSVSHSWPCTYLTLQECTWIKTELFLHEVNLETVAQKANVSIGMVSHFLKGRKDSEKVKKALAEILGYESFEKVVAASRGKVAV
jgi:transketolase N-terminal domain/subunit